MALTVRNLETLKWLGLAAMLVDHYGMWVGEPTSLTEFVGAFAFPLFGVALAGGLTHRPVVYGWRVVARLLIWAVPAQLAVMLLRDFWPLTVLVTLALGAALFVAWSASSSVVVRLSVTGVALFLSPVVEFWLPGVLFVAGLCAVVRYRSVVGGSLALLGLAGLVPLNGGGVAVLGAIPAVLALQWLPRDLPRVPGLFYRAYVVQFLAFWGLASWA